MNNKEIGKIGENVAYNYLLNNKYLILGRNITVGFNEIDIIARHMDGRLIFCEVKTINGAWALSGGLMPEDNLSHAKYRKMAKASEIFLLRHAELIYENRGWQIDLVAVLLINRKFSDLRHYENI
jgi:putative endonuclease